MEEGVAFLDELISRALAARDYAYAPYSKFKVGAAMLFENGEIATGCNVENISYGLTMCAERVAMGSAVVKGLSRIKKLAIVSDSNEPVVPCGACRQVLAEFCPTLEIVSMTLAGKTTKFKLAELLPLPRQGILE